MLKVYHSGAAVRFGVTVQLKVADIVVRSS
jgi:hypothetical protein